VTLPFRRPARALFLAGAVAVLLVPMVHAYLLMPLPGSQDLETIKLAYYLEKALRPLLLLGLLLLAVPVAQTVLHGTLGRRLLLGLFALAVAGVTYAANSAARRSPSLRRPSARP
jgi:hypothetical protein